MSDSAPAITTLQIGSSGTGNVANGVNLFRGDVNLPLDLVSLPGPNGLDVKLTALYQSNVQQQVATWNETGATSVLGVGWSLPYELLFVTGKTSTAPEDGTFNLLSGGVTAELVLTSAPEGGPWTYAPSPYRFWQIQRFFLPSEGTGPAADYWQIIKEDGLTYTYGGPPVTGSEPKDSPGDSTQWGLCWDNWIGPSQAGSPSPYALAWNLSSIADAWGNTLQFHYLRVDVPLTQLTGSPSYTQESHLESIYDAYGRKIHLHYLAKDATEYLAPNPVNAGYQDRYETLYLDQVSVRGMEDEKLFSIQFGYAGPADVLQTGVSWFVKRYLTSIVQVDHGAAALPGYQFAYYGLPPDTSTGSSVHYGALKSITYPQGATATYTYAPVTPMAGALQTSCSVSGTPGIWHGDDYVVVTSCDNGALTVTAFTWIGSWVESATQISGSSVDPSTVQVVTASGFFAVAWRKQGSTAYSVKLCAQAPLLAGQWLPPFAYSGDSPTDDSTILLAAGDQFVVAATSDSGRLTRFVYAWQDNPSPQTANWAQTSSTVTGNVLALAAADDYVLVCSCESGGTQIEFSLLRVSETAGNSWQSALSCASGTAALPPDATVPLVFLAAGDTCAAASFVTDFPSNSATYPYTVLLLTWGADFTNISSRALSTGCEVPVAAPFAFGPVIVANTLVASGPYLWRFDGTAWNSKTVYVNPNAPTAAQFAYGDDTAFCVSDGTLSGTQFDPAGGVWNAVGGLPSGSAVTASAGAATAGTSILLQTPQGEWQSPANDPALPGGAALASVQNAAPSFIVCQDAPADTPTTYLFILANGTAYQDVDIPESCWVQNAGPGQQLAGPAAFVTYAGGSFTDATSLSIYRVPAFPATGQSVSASPGGFQVTQLTVSDGVDPLPVETFYSYDPASATFDTSGTVVQYSVAAEYAGSAPPVPLTPVSCTMRYFFNGPSGYQPPVFDPPGNAIAAEYCLGLLNGMSAQTRMYDANGNLVAWAYHVWCGFVNTAATPAGATSYPGLYTALLQTVHTHDCAQLFQAAVSGSDINGLNTGNIPHSLSSPVAPYLVSSGTTLELWTLTASAAWMILAPAEDKTFFVYLNTDSTATVLGGVQRTLQYAYDPNSGQRTGKTTFYYDAAGVRHTLSEQYTPWYQQYDPGLTLNLLTPVVQTVRQTDGVTTGTEVTTWSDWSTGPTPRWAPLRSYRQRAADAAAFSDWNNQAAPSSLDWLLTSEVVQVTSRGLPAERVDAVGTHTSLLYGGYQNPDSFSVALFRNASAAGNEALYLGFEPYEAPGGWTFDTANVVPGTAWPGVVGAHTGRCSLLLPGTGSTSPGLANAFTLTPTAGNTAYVLAWWANTAAGYAAGDACWQVTVNGETAQSAIPDTGGQWLYCTFPVAVDPVAGDSFAVALACVNTSSTANVLVDDVSFWPVVGGFSARVRHHAAVTARLGRTGDTRRTGRDARGVPAVATGADGAVNAVSSRFVAGQNGAPGISGTFPNSVLNVQARDGGAYQDFATGVWQALWAGTAADWAVEGAALVHTGTAADTLAFQGSTGGGCFGVRVKVKPPAAVSYPCGISAGPVTVQCTAWAPAQGETGVVTQSWELLVNGAVTASASLAPAASGPTTQDWILVLAGESVLFYADGNPVFVEGVGTAAAGPLALFAQDGYGFEDVAVFRDPVLSTTYLDGAGRSIQSQALAWDDPADPELVVAQTLYDSLGRPAMHTKPAVCSASLFGYQSGFVESVDWLETGVMTGQVAESYPADEGYPYSRVLYDDTPLNRVAARGLPGKAYAVTDASATPPGSGQNVTTFARGGTSAAGIGAPASSQFPQFRLRQVTDADGNVTFTVRDKLHRVTARGSGNPATPGATVLQTLYSYDVDGNLTQVSPPNAGADPPEPAWVTTSTYDFLGRVAGRVSPDTGATQYIHGPAGWPAFRQDANAAAAPAPYVCYFRYDALGRVTETGRFAFEWNATTAAVLQALADEGPGLPGLDIFLPDWSTRFGYDGDGGDPLLLGRVCQALTSNGQTGVADVVERFSYDVGGGATLAVVRVGGADAPACAVSYAYDHAGHVTAMEYCVDGAVLASVRYGYDSLGRLAAVGSGPRGAEASAYAAYTYAADGSLATESIGGASPVLVFQYGYAPPGWLSSISAAPSGAAAPFGETLAYEPGYFSGAPSSIGFAYADQGPDGYSTEPQYDPEWRLDAAEVAAVPTLGSGPISYDANGNILSQTAGASPLTYAYDAVPERNTGADRLESVSTGAAGTRFAYDPNGNVVAASGLTLAYDAVTGMTTSATVDGPLPPLRASYLYDSMQRRVGKTLVRGEEVGSRLYVHGTGAVPLLELTRAGGAEPAPVVYIYGLRGLLAFRADRLYYVAKDHLGSTRVVVDEAGGVVAGYDYLPYGATGRQYGSAPEVLAYRFAGQELDAETGLYHFRARQYDAAIGRFYAPDPARQYPSPYVYAGNNPLMMVDPSGLSAVGIAFAAAGFIALAILGLVATFLTGGAAAFVVVGVGVLAGALTGLGIAAASYEISHIGGDDWNQGQFDQAVGIGALEGGVSGLVGAGLSSAVNAAGEAGLFATEATGGAKVLTSYLGVSTQASSLGIRVGIAAFSAAGATAASWEVGYIWNMQKEEPLTGQKLSLGEAAGVGAAYGAARGATMTIGTALFKSGVTQFKSFLDRLRGGGGPSSSSSSSTSTLSSSSASSSSSSGASSGSAYSSGSGSSSEPGSSSGYDSDAGAEGSVIDALEQ